MCARAAAISHQCRAHHHLAPLLAPTIGPQQLNYSFQYACTPFEQQLMHPSRSERIESWRQVLNADARNVSTYEASFQNADFESW